MNAIGDKHDTALRRLHSKGRSDQQIARALGMSRPWVNQRRRRLGLPSNNRPRAKTYTFRYVLGDEVYVLTAPPVVVQAARRALARVELKELGL